MIFRPKVDRRVDFTQCDYGGLYDVESLDKITSAKISKKDLLTNVQCFFELLIFRTLAPLKFGASKMMKIFKEGTTYERIEKKYTQKGKERILKLLIEDIGGKKPRVTKHKKIFNRIIEVIQSMIRSNE